MVLLRTLVLLMLIASVLLFAAFAITGEVRFKKLGLTLLKVTLLAAFGFFAVLIADQLF